MNDHTLELQRALTAVDRVQPLYAAQRLSMKYVLGQADPSLGGKPGH